MGTKIIEFKKTERINLSDQIIQQIKEMIEQQIVTIGDKLPSERELSESFGVSRLPLREALKTLEFIGVLEVRQGEGYFIKGLGKAKILECLNEENGRDILNDLKEARLGLEVKAIELACERRTNKDLEIIVAALEYMKNEMESGGTGIDGSLDFHNAIMGASHNRILSAFSYFIRESDLMIEGRKRSLSIPERYIRAVEEHSQMCDAVRNRDKEQAIVLMKNHIETSY